MAQVSSSFILRSKYPNFERDTFKTLGDMRDVPSTWMDEGHISYCEETEKHYIFSTKNSNNGLDRWHEIPFVVDPKDRKVLNIESVNDLDSLTCDKGTLVYINNEKEYYFFDGSNFEKLINIDVDSKLSNYYTKTQLGSWSSDNSLVEYIDNKYANKNDIVSADILRSYATESFVEQKIGSIVDEYVTIGSFESTLESYVNSKIADVTINTNNTLDKLNEHINSTNDKFSEYVTTETFNEEVSKINDVINNTNNTLDELNEHINSTNDKFSEYVTTETFNEELTNYITREEFESNSSDSNLNDLIDNITELDNKISTVSTATGALAQSLDDYKADVENEYAKKSILESDYVRGDFFQHSLGVIDQRFKSRDQKFEEYKEATGVEFEEYKEATGVEFEEYKEATRAEFEEYKEATRVEFEEYKEYVENTYIKPEEVSQKLNNYSPAIEHQNRWVGSPYAGNLAGKTGLEIANEAYSYNAVLDQMLFNEFTPIVSTPSVNISLKDNWNNEGVINWYDEKNRIILLPAGSTGPDGGDFIATNIIDSIISYPKEIDLNNKFTNGLIPSTDEQQTSIGFCKIQDENGEWIYYKKDNNIYHVPSVLEPGEYRYYMAAYFQKGSPAINNDNMIVGEWNENTPIESEDYITIIVSKPTYYNSEGGYVANDLTIWKDNMEDYMILKPSCQLEQSFKLPRKLKELYVWNDLGGYAKVPMVHQKDENGVLTETIVPAYFTETIDENDYYTYIYNSNENGHRGEIKIKVIF